MVARTHWPQLDGVRGIAIALVVGYHLGLVRGGWLGVDVFFVLSGYLITGILLDAGSPGGLRSFWGHRARRLLPAVLSLLAVLSVYAWRGGPGLVPAQLRDPALATLFYVANWQQIVGGHGYFAHFAAANPIQQTWSLSIEEQYYLVWPLVVAGLALTARSARRRGTALLLPVTVALALSSAVWMGVAAHLFGPNRAYLGTDTRAWELLLGGVAAMLWPLTGPSARPRRWSRLAALGVVAVSLGVGTAAGPPWWIWDGGLVVIAAGTGLVVVGSVRAPDGIVARVLTQRPLRWLGVISYSLYLWHWPVIVLMTGSSTGLSGAALMGARVAAMVFVACASFYLVERPLRLADWSALSGRLHLPSFGVASIGVLGTALVIVAGTVGPPLADSALVARTVHGVGRADLVEASLPATDPGHPYRAWILGDSVMASGSPGIAAALGATHDVSVVADTSAGGWGLTTAPGWADQVHQVVAQDHPQIVIGTWSWDGRDALADPAGYRALLEHFLATVLAPGDGVSLMVLAQFPQTGPNIFLPTAAESRADWLRQTEQESAWNGIAREVVGDFPGRAVFVPTGQVFAPGGRFHVWLRSGDRSWIRARMIDSIHLCPYGAALFGALVVDDLTPVLKLSPTAPRWELGSWTRDPRFDDPPGSCPDDQPPPRYEGFAVPRTSA